MALGNGLGSLFDFDPGIYSAMEGLLAGVACMWVFWGLKKVEGLGEPEVGVSSLNRGSVQSLWLTKHIHASRIAAGLVVGLGIQTLGRPHWSVSCRLL